MNRIIARMTLLAILGASSFGIVQAEPAHQSTLPPEIVDVEWALVSLQPSGAAAEDTTGLGLTLKLVGDGKASGAGGCNQFFGGYTAGGGQSLRFGPLGSTRIGCEPPISDREQRYFETLQAVSAYSLENGQLHLTTGDSGELIYASSAGAKPVELPATGAAGWTLWLALGAVSSVAAGLGMRRAAYRRSA